MKDQKPIFFVVIAIVSAIVATIFFQNCAPSYSSSAYVTSSTAPAPSPSSSPSPSPSVSMTPPPTPISCAVPAGTSWANAAGTVNCTSDAAVIISDGSQMVLNDTTAPDTGSATFSCAAGVFTLVAGTNGCVAATPTTCTVPAGTVWTDATGANTCLSDNAVTMADSAKAPLTDATGSVRGTINYTCAAGVATAVAGSAVCVNTVSPLTPNYSSIEYGTGTPTVTLNCPGASFVNGVLAMHNGSPDVLHSIQLSCQSFDLVGAATLTTPYGSMAGALSATCAAGSLASGATVHAGSYIDAFQLNCQSLGATPVNSSTVFVGGSGGNIYTPFTCPIGEYVYGVSFYLGANIDNVTFSCAKMPK